MQLRKSRSTCPQGREAGISAVRGQVRVLPARADAPGPGGAKKRPPLVSEDIRYPGQDATRQDPRPRRTKREGWAATGRSAKGRGADRLQSPGTPRRCPRRAAVVARRAVVTESGSAPVIRAGATGGAVGVGLPEAVDAVPGLHRGRMVRRTAQLSVKVSGFEEPPSVTITTGTVAAVAAWGGIVTVQVVWSGQLTEAVRPPTVAPMRPEGLRKPEPLTTTGWPAVPDDGCRLARTGGPPGVGVGAGGGTVVVVPLVGGGAGTVAAAAVVVGVVVEATGTEEEEGCGARTDDRWASGAAGGAPPPASSDPTKAATIITRAADTTATARRSARSVSGPCCAACRCLPAGDAAVAPAVRDP